MAINVTFYTMQKRDNSTKRPTGTGASFACVLKNDCGVISPRIELQLDIASNPRAWNYCYIAAFDRYYFVREWTYSTRLWIANLTEDVLASWKDTIGTSELYVVRSASSYNLRVQDSIYAPLNVPYYERIAFSTGFLGATGITDGTYILGMVGNSGSAGGVVYYAMSGAEMAQFRQMMLSELTTSWGDLSSLSGDAAKALLDPFQYVVSCLWFPITIDTVVGVTESVHFGFWDSGVTGKRLSDYTFRYQTSAVRPQLPESFGAVRGQWQYRTPFANYYIYYPPFGIIEINGANIDHNGINLQIKVDLMTGTAILTIMNADTVEIDMINAQVGVPIQLAQITTDYGGMLSGVGSVGSAIGNLLNPFNWGEIVNNIIGAGSGVAAAVSPTVRTTGTAGSISAVANLTGYFVGVYLEPEKEDLEHFGRPLCERKVINSLTGFVKVADGDIAMSGTLAEAEKIRAYMEGGFYYE